MNHGVSIRVEPSDDFAVQRLEVYAGSTLLTTQTPPIYYWQAWNVPNGPYTLTARAYDAAGNVTQSTVNVTVDNDFSFPSEPVLTSPAAGAALSGTVTLDASASDDRQVTLVEFFVDGELIGTDTTAPFALTWDSVAVTLVRGRGPGSEPNSPNTLDGCLDGTRSGLEEDIRGLRVIAADGLALTAGKRVRVEVDVVTDNKAHAHGEGLRQHRQRAQLRRGRGDSRQHRAHRGPHLSGQRHLVLLPHLQHHPSGQRQ